MDICSYLDDAYCSVVYGVMMDQEDILAIGILIIVLMLGILLGKATCVCFVGVM